MASRLFWFWSFIFILKFPHFIASFQPLRQLLNHHSLLPPSRPIPPVRFNSVEYRFTFASVNRRIFWGFCRNLAREESVLWKGNTKWSPPSPRIIPSRWVCPPSAPISNRRRCKAWRLCGSNNAAVCLLMLKLVHVRQSCLALPVAEMQLTRAHLCRTRRSRWSLSLWSYVLAER